MLPGWFGPRDPVVLTASRTSASTGRYTLKQVPLGSAVSSSLPPWACTMPFAMDRPSPAPAFLELLARPLVFSPAGPVVGGLVPLLVVATVVCVVAVVVVVVVVRGRRAGSNGAAASSGGMPRPSSITLIATSA